MSSPKKAAIPYAGESHWLWGHLLTMRRDILGFFARCEREHGAIVRLRLYATSVYLVSGPELIHEILITQQANFLKPTGLKAVKPMFGEGLLTADGEVWQVHRKLVQPAFRRECINRYSLIAVSCTDRLLDNWSEGERRDIYVEMHTLTLDIVARALFGTDVRTGRSLVTTGTRAIQDYFLAWRRHYFPLPSWAPLPSTMKVRRAVRDLDAMMYRLIEEREASDEPEQDLLSSLIRAHQDDGTRMSRTMIRDQMVTLFLAGHETTAVSLAWAWYMLALHPHVATKLHAELASVLGDRAPNVEDLPNLVYLDQVFKEVMRLYPSTYNIGRIARGACKIGGYAIEAGRDIIMSQWAIHRSSRYYDSPEEFCPERWEPTRAAKVPKFAYIPFGAGPRTCIGAQFALMEAKMILATIARRYTLELRADSNVEVDAALTLRPANGLPMTVRVRSA
jgi:cytochrome P450